MHFMHISTWPVLSTWYSVLVFSTWYLVLLLSTRYSVLVLSTWYSVLIISIWFHWHFIIHPGTAVIYKHRCCFIYFFSFQATFITLVIKGISPSFQFSEAHLSDPWVLLYFCSQHLSLELLSCFRQGIQVIMVPTDLRSNVCPLSQIFI